ncbi:MAG: hypothetical protein NVV83_04615 [Afipia sp.]|nr:hypothetical protein [Afipia sp.]
MLESHEKWIGPFQIRDLLEFSLKGSHIPQPPDSGSTYLVSKHSWQTHPSGDSEALYIGGNTGRSARFRTRMGDLLAMRSASLPARRDIIQVARASTAGVWQTTSILSTCTSRGLTVLNVTAASKIGLIAILIQR